MDTNSKIENLISAIFNDIESELSDLEKESDLELESESEK
jgi:hypothetical protein